MKKEQSHFLPIFSASLAVLVGIARGIGGFSLITSGVSTSEIAVGVGLIVVALWLIISGVICLGKKESSCYRWLVAGAFAFWLDGIINGFILFGGPLLSGQIINAVILILIVIGSYQKIKK